MDRRRFLAQAGLLTVGGAAGVGAGLAAEQLLTQEGPTARTARPAGPARYVATATFRTELSAKLIALTIDSPVVEDIAQQPTPHHAPSLVQSHPTPSATR